VTFAELDQRRAATFDDFAGFIQNLLRSLALLGAHNDLARFISEKLDFVAFGNTKFFRFVWRNRDCFRVFGVGSCNQNF
jgi:hypothetical protein